MVHRDPQTGQFVSTDSDMFDDIEVATFRAGIGVQAADLDGATGFIGENDNFEGIQVVDYDDLVDRSEELHLLQAHHALTVFSNSTQTADGTVSAAVEVSASPSRSSGLSIGTANLDGAAVGSVNSQDSIDNIGRQLVATAHAPFSDGSTGVGGGGSAGHDTYQGDMFPSEFGRFHPRDELFVNGQFRTWNVDDSGVHLTIGGQHVYGVISGV